MRLNARVLGFTAALAALAVAGLAAAECAPSLTWANRYSGPGGGTDLAYGTAINPSNGDVYVVGSEYFSPAQGNNWRIRRYNSAGTLQNTATYDGALSGDDVCTYVAVDQAGGVIVSGYEEVVGQGINWLVRKYSTDLSTVAWSYTFNGAASSFDEAASVAVIPDGTNDVVAAGYITDDGVGFTTDARLVKLASATGAELWSTTYVGPAGGDDAAQSVTVEPSGSTYIAGYTYVNGQDKNWLVIKYSLAGNWLWRNTWNDDVNSEDIANSVAVDPRNGNVIVAGYETRPDRLEGQNWMIRSFDRNLNGLRSRKYSEGNTEQAFAVSVDANGSVYVAGMIDRWWVNEWSNWMVLKLDPDLVPARTLTYGSAGANGDAATGIAVDASGNLVVSGYEWSTSKAEDWLVMKFAQPASCSNEPTVALSVDHSPVAETEKFALDLKVTAMGVARTGILPFVATTLLTGDFATARYDTLTTPDPATQPSLAAGASRDFIWTYRFHGDGTGQFLSWAEYDIGNGVKVSTEAVSTNFAFSTLAGARGHNTPTKPGIDIRNNVVRIGSNKLAQILVTKAAAGSTVALTVYTSAGIGVGSLPSVTVDGAGSGYAAFDGTVDGKPLRTGVYHLVATGGITDRKPVMVIRE